MKKNPTRFAELTRIDLETWPDCCIVSRGKRFQQQGLRPELATLCGEGPMASILGTDQYISRPSTWMTMVCQYQRELAPMNSTNACAFEASFPGWF